MISGLDRMVNRSVILSLELCQAYITSEDDVLTKLSRIIEIDRVRDQFHREAIERQKEAITELSLFSRMKMMITNE